MNIHPNDEQALLTMLGETDLPPAVRDEAALRTHLFHRASESGPLGTLALIALIRDLKLSPPQLIAKPEPPNWRIVKRGTAVEVAKPGERWKPGTFQGFIQHNSLGVVFEGDEWVHEVTPDCVRLPSQFHLDQVRGGPIVGVVQAPPDPPPLPITDTLSVIVPPAVDLPPAPFEIIPEPVFDEETVGGPLDQPPEIVSPPQFDAMQSVDAVYDEKPTTPPRFTETDWLTTATGTSVWVDHDGDIQDARFVCASADGQTLSCLISGEAGARDFPANKVQFVG